MRNSKILVCFFLPLVLLAWTSLAIAAPAGSAKPGKSATSNASRLREIEYPALVDKIGHKLIISTTNDTTRSGVLTRYTNVTISLQLGPEAGSIELSVPRNSIRKIMIEIAPADPLFLNEVTPQEDKAGAKKN